MLQGVMMPYYQHLGMLQGVMMPLELRKHLENVVSRHMMREQGGFTVQMLRCVSAVSNEPSEAISCKVESVREGQQDHNAMG